MIQGLLCEPESACHLVQSEAVVLQNLWKIDKKEKDAIRCILQRLREGMHAGAEPSFGFLLALAMLMNN